jgi:hypothetical protein
MKVLFAALIVLAARSAGAQRAPGTILGAYYDGKLFSIHFRELPSGGEIATHDHNGSINIIYQCDACADALPGGFVSVINAIQGDGFNPLWEEQQITFNAGFAPRQLFSDNDVLAAQAAGEITITDTDEIYTCAVTGPKK